MLKLLPLVEKVELDVEIGDTILTGKFRNKKTVVKTMSIDGNGQLIINGKKMTNFRTTKRVNIFDEVIEEGRYDKQVSDLTKTVVKLVKQKKKRYQEDLYILENDVSFEVSVKYTTKMAKAPFAIHGDTSRLNFTFGRYLEMGLQIFINEPLFTSKVLNDFVAEVKEAIRHEVEHVTQHIIRKKPTTRKGTSDLPPMEYLLHRVEKPAFMAGFFTKAKTKKVTMDVVIDDFLKGYTDELSAKQLKQVKRV